MYVPQAQCKTVVPDLFRVLLSQRRRWINSTVHNLMELVLVSDLCGIACLSMQFFGLCGSDRYPRPARRHLSHSISCRVHGRFQLPAVAIIDPFDGHHGSSGRTDCYYHLQTGVHSLDA